MDRVGGAKALRPERLWFCWCVHLHRYLARNATEYRKKADTIASTLSLYVMDVEGEQRLNKWTAKRTPSDEMEDMIQRAESNPDAIVYGTFHEYRVDQA